MNRYNSSSPGVSAPQHESWPKIILDRLLGFWFKPTDLTTIGAMRICGGLLFLYILFIYCYDLQSLLGMKRSEAMGQLG